MSRIQNILVILDDGTIVKGEFLEKDLVLDCAYDFRLGTDLEQMITYFDMRRDSFHFVKSIELVLSHNNLSTARVLAFLAHMRAEKFSEFRQKLVRLTMTHNNVEIEGFRELFAFLQECPRCEYVDASINNASISEVAALTKPSQLTSFI